MFVVLRRQADYIMTIEMKIITILILVICIDCDISLELQLPVLTKNISRLSSHIEIEKDQKIMLAYKHINSNQVTTKYCHQHPSYLQLQIFAEYSRQFSNKKQQFVYNTKYKNIYRLTTTSIIAYAVEKANTIKQINQIKFDTTCTKSMVLDNTNEYLYIVSCEAIYLVACKSVLVSLQSIYSLSPQFHSYQTKKFSNLVFDISMYQGIRIFGFDISSNLTPVNTISSFKNKSLMISDVYYENQLVYVLDKKEGLLIYQRNGINFIEKDKIELQIFQNIEFNQLLISNNTFFVSFSTQNDNAICEFQYHNGRYYLNRYYKGFAWITNIFLVNQQLLVVQNSKIQFYPIRRDPRTIQAVFNSIGNAHQKDIISVFPVQNHTFIIVKPSTYQLVQMTPIDRKLQCEFQVQGHYNINLQRYCYSNGHSFSNECIQMETIDIQVSVIHKDSYVWLIFVFLSLLVLVSFGLIYWRDLRLAKIMEIVDEIKTMRLKKEDFVQFKELEQPKLARQWKWQDITDDNQSNDTNNLDYYLQSQRNKLEVT